MEVKLYLRFCVDFFYWEIIFKLRFLCNIIFINLKYSVSIIEKGVVYF